MRDAVEHRIPRGRTELLWAGSTPSKRRQRRAEMDHRLADLEMRVSELEDQHPHENGRCGVRWVDLAGEMNVCGKPFSHDGDHLALRGAQQ